MRAGGQQGVDHFGRLVDIEHDRQISLPRRARDRQHELTETVIDQDGVGARDQALRIGMLCMRQFLVAVS